MFYSIAKLIQLNKSLVVYLTVKQIDSLFFIFRCPDTKGNMGSIQVSVRSICGIISIYKKKAKIKVRIHLFHLKK